MPDPTPQVIEAAQRFRAALLARERRAATALVRYYGAGYARLQSDIRTLQTEIAQQRAAGETISPGRLWRLERMQRIQQQAAQEMASFAEFADTTIQQAQREAIAAGQRDSYELVQASFLPSAGVEVNFARLPTDAVETLVGTLADGSPLRDLIAEAVGEAADGFSETMVTGLVAGWNPRKLARELRSAYGMGLTRSMRIARTEQLRAYREATRHTYQENRHVVTGWERLAAQDDRTCMACVVLDGKRYELDEPMDDHVQGRCAMIPLTVTYRELGLDVDEPDFTREKASDWFLRQDEGTQRRMMGPGMFEAWQAGEFKLEDIPKQIRSEVWGNSWVPKSLRELSGNAGD